MSLTMWVCILQANQEWNTSNQFNSASVSVHLKGGCKHMAIGYVVS